MTLGITELDAVVSELGQVLTGARLTGVDAMPRGSVRLRLATETGLRLVRISARLRMARIHLDSPSPGHRREEDQADSGVRGFAARLARELRGATLTSVHRVFQDRVVEMVFQRDPHPRLLIFECSGHHPNLFLVDDRRVILSSLLPSRSIRRDLRPGRPYRPPLPHEHEGPEALRFLQGPVSEAIAAWYHDEEEREERRQDLSGMRRALKARLARQDRLVLALEEDLRQAIGAAGKVHQGQASEREARRAQEQDRIRSRLQAVQAFREEIRVLLEGLIEGGPEAVRKASRFLSSSRSMSPAVSHPGPRGQSATAGGGASERTERLAPSLRPLARARPGPSGKRPSAAPRRPSAEPSSPPRAPGRRRRVPPSGGGSSG